MQRRTVLGALGALVIAGCGSVPTVGTPDSGAPASDDPLSPTPSASSAPSAAPSASAAAVMPSGLASAPTGSKRSGSFAAGEQLVWIQAKGHRVPGTLHLAGAAPAPVVLMLHGDASSRDEVGNMYADEALALASKGISSLRIDFPGSGMAELGERKLDYPTMVGDAEAALTWLQGQDWVAGTRIGVLGFSRGATVAATLVGRHPEVAALASWSGAVENGTHEDPQHEAIAAKQGHVVEDLGFRTFDYSYAWFTSIAASHALTDVRSYAGPLLIVYGTADTDVPPAAQLRFATATRSGDVTRLPIAGADHIYGVLGANKQPSRTVVAATADWFGRHLA